MTEEEPKIGWVLTRLDDGRWAASYTAQDGMFVAGFASSAEAGDWLIQFFDSNTRREMDYAFRERRAKVKEELRRAAILATLLGEQEKGKVH